MFTQSEAKGSFHLPECYSSLPTVLLSYRENSQRNFDSAVQKADILYLTSSNDTMNVFKTTILLLSFSACIQLQARAQQTADSLAQEKIFEKVEIESFFPGGNKAWIIFLQKNLNPNIPIDKKAPAGTYTVIVQFVVGSDGTITDITPLTNHGYGMENEVVRILKLSPKWHVAEQDGRKVKTYRKQPVTFVVPEEEQKSKKKKKN